MYSVLQTCRKIYYINQYIASRKGGLTEKKPDSHSSWGRQQSTVRGLPLEGRRSETNYLDSTFCDFGMDHPPGWARDQEVEVLASWSPAKKCKLTNVLCLWGGKRVNVLESVLILSVFTIILGIFTCFLGANFSEEKFCWCLFLRLSLSPMEWKGKLRLTTSSGKWMSRLAASLHSLRDQITRIYIGIDWKNIGIYQEYWGIYLIT